VERSTPHAVLRNSQNTRIFRLFGGP
jgi:hypothetical protein